MCVSIQQLLPSGIYIMAIGCQASERRWHDDGLKEDEREKYEIKIMKVNLSALPSLILLSTFDIKCNVEGGKKGMQGNKIDLSGHRVIYNNNNEKILCWHSLSFMLQLCSLQRRYSFLFTHSLG